MHYDKEEGYAFSDLISIVFYPVPKTPDIMNMVCPFKVQVPESSALLSLSQGVTNILYLNLKVNSHGNQSVQ